VVPRLKAILFGLVCTVLVGLASTLAVLAVRPLPVNPPAPLGAGPLSTAECTPNAAMPKRQLRAMWIATVDNIDWPSRPGLSAAAVQAQYLSYLDLAQRLHFNAVLVQIRPGGDAFWPSRYEPWSWYLTGVAGRDPGWDPLQFMVDEAHKRGIQFHAWFNPYRLGDPARFAPNGPAKLHPDWLIHYPATSKYTYYNPGIPAVRAFVEDAIMDAVTRYNIDGVHMDDFFYPYPVGKQDFNDWATFNAYHGAFTNRPTWRRNNINLLIQELDQRVHAAKPWVAFGISPFGIWRNATSDKAGSQTNGLESYSANFADTLLWVKRGWIDYIVPQLYWQIGFPQADYTKLLRWWSAAVSGTGVRLYIGQAMYRVGVRGAPKAWFNPDELSRHLALNQKYPQVDGDMYFNAKSLRVNRLGAVSRLVTRYYQRPALVPELTGASELTPSAPVPAGTTRDATSVTVHWQQPDNTVAIYRFDAAAEPKACDLADASHLVAVTGGTQWTDTTVTAGHRYTYYLTTVDRSGRESEPSPAVVSAAANEG
jgi:uncharacterized lipoprotein YddW (UPF0748 family)